MADTTSIRNVAKALLRWRAKETVLLSTPNLISYVDDIPDDADIADVVNSAVDICVQHNGKVSLSRELFDGMFRFVLRDTRDMASRTGCAEGGDLAYIVHATSSPDGMATVLLCVMLDEYTSVLTTEPAKSVVRAPEIVPHENPR